MSESLEIEPSSFEKAVQQPLWVDAMVVEYDSIIRNNGSKVVPRPEEKSVVSSRWFYKVKQGTYGSVEKCDEKLVKYFKEDLAREFEMKDMGLMHYFISMEVWKGYEKLFVSQCKYANKILNKFHMERRKPMETPLVENWRKENATSGEVVEATIYRKLVGSLMYLVNT
eukprot:PITA_05364